MLAPAVTIIAWSLCMPPLHASEIDYLKDVKPIFTARCYACHGALQQKSGLRIDTAKAMIDAGVVVPGKSQESTLLAHVQGKDGLNRMPPPSEGEGLTARQIESISKWIEAGAIAPADEKSDPDPREHWAFRAPYRPRVPVVSSYPIRNEVDAFLAVQWAKHGIRPAPAAEKRLLLRRVSLDLIGLPPTHEETMAFLHDDAADAYEKVVDRLLRSPHYGERWGRHFLDIWRYSDWWGLGPELRNSQKHIWHWRDWVVESLNADLGYDKMIVQMLAADELHPEEPEKLRATGFLARSYFRFNRTSWLDEVIEHTGKAFLGLTFNCAKCHDHKYDPVRHNDYYRFRAFFEPYQVRTDLVPGQPDHQKDGIPRVFDCNLDAPTYKHERGDERRPLKDKSFAPGVPDLLAFTDLKIEPVALPKSAHSPKGSVKTPESNLETDVSLKKPFPTTSTGRRTALARWIADKRNPLTARVLVNHVWARHFGRPLVPTVFDFGRKGAMPSHPELLDWLAKECMERDWSIKQLHRVIVTSAAYRMSSQADAESLEASRDPENRLLGHQNSQRMEAQVVRDSLLHLAGRLKPTLGGASIPQAEQEASTRRSLYFFQSHNEHNPFLAQFDDANVLECYRRTESIVPQQALALSNSRLAIDMSEAIAARLHSRDPAETDTAYIQSAFLALLGYAPSKTEESLCLEALVEWTATLTAAKHADPKRKARVNLVGALINHNDFVTIR